MTDARIIPAEELDIDAATIIIAEQRWEDNELLDTQEMADLFEACHRLRAHIAAQEAVIGGLTGLVREVLDVEPIEMDRSGFDRCIFCGELTDDEPDDGNPHATDCWIVRADALASPAARTAKGAGDDDTD